jgi:hypothetical protein
MFGRWQSCALGVARRRRAAAAAAESATEQAAVTGLRGALAESQAELGKSQATAARLEAELLEWSGTQSLELQAERAEEGRLCALLTAHGLDPRTPLAPGQLMLPPSPAGLEAELAAAELKESSEEAAAQRMRAAELSAALAGSEAALAGLAAQNDRLRDEVAATGRRVQERRQAAEEEREALRRKKAAVSEWARGQQRQLQGLLAEHLQQQQRWRAETQAAADRAEAERVEGCRLRALLATRGLDQPRRSPPPSVGDSNRAHAAAAPARAVLGYDTTGDGRPDAFDTNQDGRIDVRGGAGVEARSPAARSPAARPPPPAVSQAFLAARSPPATLPWTPGKTPRTPLAPGQLTLPSPAGLEAKLAAAERAGGAAAVELARLEAEILAALRSPANAPALVAARTF